MCYLAHAPPVARVLAGLVEIMGRAVRPPEALRGLQRRLSMRSAHRETQVAQEAVRESRVCRHNYALSLIILGRFEEARSLLLKTLPLARRVYGENHETTIRLRGYYAVTLIYYRGDNPMLDDIREAVTMLEDAVFRARRLLGGAHPVTAHHEGALQKARTILRAFEKIPRA